MKLNDITSSSIIPPSQLLFFAIYCFEWPLDNFFKNYNKNNKVGQSWIELFHGLVLKDKALRILILQKEGMLQSGSPID